MNVRDKLANDVYEMILAMRTPEFTPEQEKLHQEIAHAAINKQTEQMWKLIDQCEDFECIVCGELACPYGEPLHFHHDGCPACIHHQEEGERP